MSNINVENEHNVEDNQSNEPYQENKSRKVLIQQYDYAVRTLMDMIVEEDLILNPDYQRNYRWDNIKASRYIESIILNIPVPVIYLAEEANGVFSVIDGQQRLTSLFRFIKPNDLLDTLPKGDIDELRLEGLRVRADLNGKQFAELDRIERSNLTKRPIRCIVVLNESDPILKFEVFERLNTGSAELTDQEVRNCIYKGSYNDLIKKCACNLKFLELIALPDPERKKMKAEEFVLRYLAYLDAFDTGVLSDNYSEQLNSHFEMNRAISTSHANDVYEVFNKTIDIVYKELGPGKAFRRPRNQHDHNDGFAHTQINGAIFESQMIAISQIVKTRNTIPNGLEIKLLNSFKDDIYWSSIFQGTAKKRHVNNRFDTIKKIIGSEDVF